MLENIFQVYASDSHVPYLVKSLQIAVITKQHISLQHIFIVRIYTSSYSTL